MAKFYGSPPGVSVGSLFGSRKELSDANVHRPTQGGIHGNKREGADSVCLSGGYPDDRDYGDYIIYTGHGGNDRSTRKQVADQSIHAYGNAGLVTSWVQGLPVRVVRGSKHPSPYSPPTGFVYAGLYGVTSSWVEVGNDGFEIVRFRLDRLPDQANLWTKVTPEPDPTFGSSTVSRRIRDSALSRRVKTMYRNRCQICGIAIPGLGSRFYSEGAHVKPLGRPHLGPDSLDNILCLCPNHHVQLDIGGMVVLENNDVAATATSKPFASLTFASAHTLNPVYSLFHRNLWT